MAASLRLGLAYLIIGIAPVAFGVRGVRESHIIAPTSLSHVDGANYIASVPPSPFWPLLVAASDNLSHLQRSSGRLFEDARELRPAHAVHAGIAAVGKGRFSHWTTAIYLSASDNSDPRTNGRAYRFEMVAQLPTMVIVAWAVTFLFSMVVSPWLWQPGGPAPTRWLPRLRPAILAVASLAAIAMMTIAGRGTAQVFALASWLLVGFVAAFFAGVVIRRASTAGFIRAVAEESPAFGAALKSLGHIVTSLDQRISDAPGWKGLAARIGCLAAPVGIFIVTLTTAWPDSLLVQTYYGGGRVFLTAGAALWLAHARRGWLAIVLGLTVTLALFGLALAALWQDVAIHYNALGGLLPWSDPQGYFFEASRLLEGQPLQWSARRPLFPAFLAVLLAVTGSLHVALAVMVALNAAATFLLAREVSRSFGSAAATVTTLILFAFYRSEGGTGVVMTENLGFLLGTAGFTALLRGMRLQDIRSYAFGAAVLTGALMARAGALFVLPTLVVAALMCRLNNGSGRRHNLKSAVITICAIVIAGTTFLAWGRAVSNRVTGNAAFSNYSTVLYGLAVGGKGWAQVTIDHPNAREGAEIYKLAYEAFRARPSGLVVGMARMVRVYLWPSGPYHMFAFIQDGPRTGWLQGLCYILVFVGLAVCAWKWRDPVHLFVVAIAAGHFASIPFVPPMDAGLRVYAATIPVLPLLAAAAIGVAANLFAKFRRQPAKQTALQPAFDVTNRLSESAALGLVAVIMGASWALYMAGEPRMSITRPTCPSGSESLVVRVDNDVVVRVEEDKSTRAISPTVSRESELRRTVGQVELKGEAPNIRSGMSLRLTYDPTDGRQVWLVGNSDRLARRSELLQICGHYTRDATARRYGLMFVDEAYVSGVH